MTTKKRATGRVSESGAGIVPTRTELAHILKMIERRGPGNAFYLGADAALKLALGKCEDPTLLGMLTNARKELGK